MPTFPSRRSCGTPFFPATAGRAEAAPQAAAPPPELAAAQGALRLPPEKPAVWPVLLRAAVLLQLELMALRLGTAE
jgi:hypothetical protein